MKSMVGMTVLLLMKVKNLFLFVVKLDSIPHPFGVGYLFQWSLRFASLGVAAHFQCRKMGGYFSYTLTVQQGYNWRRGSLNVPTIIRS